MRYVVWQDGLDHVVYADSFQWRVGNGGTFVLFFDANGDVTGVVSGRACVFETIEEAPVVL